MLDPSWSSCRRPGYSQIRLTPARRPFVVVNVIEKFGSAIISLRSGSICGALTNGIFVSIKVAFDAYIDADWPPSRLPSRFLRSTM